jgi:hypothetical protein
MKGISLFGVLCSLWLQGLTQTSLFELKIQPVYGNQPFNLVEPFQTNDNNQTQLDELRFYLSHIRFTYKGEVVFAEQQSFQLVDATLPQSFNRVIQLPVNLQFDRVCFDLGIDSATQVDGVKGGDLDPTKGMYWSWQSGYINVKLEGKSALCATRNHQFQFHLGGYLPPYLCLQTVTIPATHTDELLVQLDVQQILSQLNLAQVNQVMSPSVEAVRLFKIVAQAFRVAPK